MSTMSIRSMFGCRNEKDFLLIEEAKNRRKRTVKENRHISSKRSSKSEITTLSNVGSLLETLDEMDRVSLNSAEIEIQTDTFPEKSTNSINLILSFSY